MTTLEREAKDPVCGMMVDDDRYQSIHENVRYVFCCLQCVERFVEHPRLYVTVDGRPPVGRTSRTRRRRWTFSRPLAAAEAHEMVVQLRSMMGVRGVRLLDGEDGRDAIARKRLAGEAVRVQTDTVEVTYDLFEATAGQVERRIVEVGLSFSDGTGEKLKRDFIRYVESCELTDLVSEGA